MAITGAKEYRVRINSDAVLILRRPSPQESSEYLARLAKAGSELSDAFLARIEYADLLLIGCEEVEYIDEATGEVKTLTPEVPGWVAKIEDSWKFGAVRKAFEAYSTEMDDPRGKALAGKTR
jgi:hypothetical protein